GPTRATTANPIKPTLPFSRIPGLEVFGSVAAIPVVFRHYGANPMHIIGRNQMDGETGRAHTASLLSPFSCHGRVTMRP
ncbi:hypothetical protein, partial [Burkholderia multivorans]|uniref:hypothetical protein n=1 Tax=Burkholderia multivorans TaxID=87883 RepID=UPI0021BF95FD